MATHLPTPPSEGSVTASQATVYIHTPFHPEAERYAEKRFRRVVRPGQDGMDRDKCLAECDGVLLRQGTMPAEALTKASKLRLIARNGTGCDTIDLAKAKELGIVVTNVPGGNAKDVAELALTLMLCVLRRVVEVNRRILRGERVPSIDALAPGLYGKTVGLIGMGDIAYELCALLQPFGCTLLIHSPTSPASRWIEPDARHPLSIPHERVSRMDELLRRSDVVSLHCPMTPATKGLIGEREMGIMKPGSVLINTARGGMVDEAALAKALREGPLGGAGLDVMVEEPPFGDSLGALRYLDNVIITPHMAGATDATTYRGCVEAIDILADFLDGKPARNRVV